MTGSGPRAEQCPVAVDEYARQAVAYVDRALGMTLEYDSDTLPILDHYLRTLAGVKPALLHLVVLTAGAYFGEVIRRRLGGRWELSTDDPRDWRVVLPTGLSFSPAGVVAEAIAQGDVEEWESCLDAPPKMRGFVQEALERMGAVTVETYYSLCGRLDTLEHLHAVMLARAGQILKP